MAEFRRATRSSHKVTTVAIWWGLAEASASASLRPPKNRQLRTLVMDGLTPEMSTPYRYRRDFKFGQYFGDLFRMVTNFDVTAVMQRKESRLA